MHDTVHSPSPRKTAEVSAPTPAPAVSPSRPRKLRRVLILTSAVAVACLAYFLLTVFVLFNLHEVVPNQVYRSSQPSPAFLATLAREKQIRSVIKLNSEKESDWSKSEESAASQLGIQFIHVGIGVSELPSRHELIEIVNAVDAAPRPMLIHCKTGADRTGVVSAMARMRDGDSFDKATADQLKLRYFHFGHIGEDVGDLFKQYRADRAAANLPTGGWSDFKAYVLRDYYPDFYHAGIEPSLTQIKGLPGETVTVDVKLTNRSPRPWPKTAGHPLSLNLGREPAALAQISVPALAPRESVTLRVPVTVPDLSPGTYQFPFDIAHGTLTWFALRGSSPTPISVTVRDPSLAQSDHANPQP
jgi:protein tyrosine phosphatase (PTP) superfamily phosphohydrolase (DUF442 family)